MTDSVSEAVDRIKTWGEARDWRGYDPFDGLLSPLAPLLTLRTKLGKRLLVQAVKLSPLNLRPVLRIKPSWNYKAIALVASGYARLWAAERDRHSRAHASRWLEALLSNHSGGADGLAWGYPFELQTRFFLYPQGTPNTVATSFVAQALLDGAELLDNQRWGEQARAAAGYLETRMLVEDRGRTYFRYLPEETELIHNANMLAAATLVRTARVAGESRLLEPAAAAVATTLAAQRSDGSWPYAEGPGGSWVDNFHTGYVLESLAECLQLLPNVREPLTRGLDYWERELFLPDGTPKYYSNRTFPIDAHCYAQAIDTWLSVSDWHPRAYAQASHLAELLTERMLDPSGFVHFQRRRFWTSRVPLVRWTTAPSFRALAGLLLARARRAKDEHANARLD
jgi:hypothetical protein